MAENLGGYEVSVELKDKITQAAEKAEKSIQNIAQSTEYAQKKMEGLVSAISTLAKTKGNDDGIFSKSEADRINKAIVKAVANMERLKGLVSQRASIGLDTSEAQKRIEQVEALIKKFYAGDGSIRSKHQLQGILESTDVVKFSKDFDYFVRMQDKAATASEKAAERIIRSKQKEQEALDRAAEREAIRQAQRDNRAWTQGTSRADLERSTLFGATLKRQMEEELRREQAQLQVAMQTRSHRTMTTAERNSFKVFYAEQEREAQAAEKALDGLASKNSKVTREVTSLNEKIRALYQTSNKMRDLGMDTTRLMQARDELRKIVDLYNLLNGKGSTKRDFLEADASKVKALEQYRMALAAAERELKRFNETQKMSVKRNNQIDTLERQINQLKATLAKANAKQYRPDVDTSKVEAAKQTIRLLINEYREMQQALRNGGALYSKSELSGGKSVTLRDLSVAQAQANVESKKAVQAAREQEKANKQAEEATRRNAQQIKQIAQQYRNLESAAKGANSTVGQLKNLLWQFAPLYGMQQLVMSVIQVGGEIEKQHIALRSIIGDLQDADELFGQIKGLALSSPFTFGELNRDVKQLAAFGVEADDLYDTTKRLADISSGLGVSFERLGLAYGQVKARSWLDGKELRQFAYAGVPLLQKLADMYTKQGDHAYTTGEVRQMVFKRQVSFEDVQQVLWDMTNKGGQFYNMQETLSQTLYGRYNKLVDAWEIMLSEFAKGDSVVGGTMKNILNFITNIILGFNKAAGVVTAFFATFALKKVGTWMFNNTLGGRSATNMQTVLQKQYTEALVKDKAKLTSLDRQLLASQGRITAEMVKQLEVEHGLSAVEAHRVTNAALMRQGWQQGIFKGGAKNFFGGALGAGIMSLGKGIQGLWSMIGGLPGALMTAGFVAYAKYEQYSAEVDRVNKAVTEGIEDRHKRLVEFLNSHPVKTKFDTTQDAENELSDLLTEYKQMMGTAFSFGLDIDATVIEKITKVREELEKIAEAQETVKRIQSEWGQEMTKSPLNFWSDSVEGNIEDLQKKFKALTNALNDPETTKQQFAVLEDEVKRNYNTLYTQLKPHFEKLWKPIANSGKPIEEQRIMFESQLNAWIGSIEGMSDEMGFALRTMAHDALRMNNVDTFADLVIGRVDPKVLKSFTQDIKDGLKVEDIAKGKGREAITAAIEELKAEWPSKAADFQRLLNSTPFYITVIEKHTNGVQEQPLTNTMLKRAAGKYGWMSDGYFDVKGDIERHTQAGTFTELQKSAKSDLDAAKREFDLIKQSIKKGSEEYTTKELEKAKEKLDKFKTLYYDIYGFTDDDKKGRGGSRVPRDFELDGLKKRWDAIEKLIALWKKYRDLYGAIEATKRVTRKAEQEGITDIKDWADEVGVRQKVADEAKALIGKGRKEWQEARKATWQVKETNVETAQYDKEKRVVDALTKSYQEFVQQLKAQYELRDQLRKKFGKNIANDLADNVTTYTDTEGRQTISLGERLVDDLEKRLRSRLAEVNKRDNKDYTLEWAIQQKEDVIVDSFSKDGDIQSMIKDLRQARMDLEKEAVNTVTEELDKLDDEETRIARITNELAETKRKIGNLVIRNSDGSVNVAATEEYKSHATGIAEADANLKMIKASDSYRTFERAAWMLTEEQINKERERMANALKESYDKNRISEENYLKGLEEIDKAYQAAISRMNAFSQFAIAYSSASGYRNILRHMEGVSYVGTDSKRDKRLGLVQGVSYSRKYIYNRLEQSMKNLQESTSGVISGLQALDSALTPVYSLLEKIGGKDLAGILGAEWGNKALSSASGVAGAFSTLSKATGDGVTGLSGALGAAGPYGAAAAAAISVASDIIGDPDADRQAMIDELQTGNSLLEKLASFLSESLGKLAGGVYSWSAHKADQGLSILDDLLNVTYHIDKSFLHELFTGKESSSLGSHLSAETQSAIAKAKKTRSYYDEQYAILLAQKDNYEEMLHLEQDKKDADNSKIYEFNQEIIKAKEAVRDFARTMAEELYNIDFSSYSDSLASSLVDAWAAGTNSVKAYREAVNDSLKDVAQNVVKQKVLGTWLDNEISEWYRQFEESKGVMDDMLYNHLAVIFRKLQERTELVNSAMDSMEEVANLYGYSMKDKKASSLSSAIAGVTEDTADLLASYMNAIRADVSLNRGYLQRLMEEVMPTISSTANLGLIELRGIKTTLDGISASIDRMDERMDDVVYGRKNLSVTVRNVA